MPQSFSAWQVSLETHGSGTQGTACRRTRQLYNNPSYGSGSRACPTLPQPPPPPESRSDCGHLSLPLTLVKTKVRVLLLVWQA